MKKDRNCGAVPYPIYPMPGMVMPNMMPNMGPMPANFNQGIQNQMPQGGTGLEQQVNMLNNQINNLEKRVSNLEGLVGNTNNYNTSNFQMI